MPRPGRRRDGRPPRRCVAPDRTGRPCRSPRRRAGAPGRTPVGRRGPAPSAEARRRDRRWAATRGSGGRRASSSSTPARPLPSAACRGSAGRGPAMRGFGPVVRPSAAAAPPRTRVRSPLRSGRWTASPLPEALSASPSARWSGRSKIGAASVVESPGEGWSSVVESSEEGSSSVVESFGEGRRRWSSRSGGLVRRTVRSPDRVVGGRSPLDRSPAGAPRWAARGRLVAVGWLYG